MASILPAFTCQNCHQPIQLDVSVAEADPKAVLESLPEPSNLSGHRSPTTASLTPAQRLAKINASPIAKAAWEAANLRAMGDDAIKLLPASSSPTSPIGRRVPSTSISSSSTANARNNLTPTSRRDGTSATSAAGAESFVLLPGSAVNRIPKATSPIQRQASGSSPGAGKRISSVAAGKKPASQQPGEQMSSDANAGTSSSPNATVKSTPPTTNNLNSLHSSLRVLNILSAHSTSTGESGPMIDHPLCSECTNTLLDNLQRKLDETKRERDGYAAFEKEARKSREAAIAAGGSPSVEAEEKKLQQKITKLEMESQRVINELRQAEMERVALESELAALQEEEDALEEEEIAFWTERSRTQMQAARQKDTLTSVTSALTQAQAELTQLARTNVYNDAFCIGHDGPFGTLNGLRLGRVPGVNVEWAEINAAWGQAVLLLHTTARKVGFVFETYRLIPMGSFSKIERLTGDRGTYELYGSGDINITRMLHNRRFDFAMVAYLDCLRQMQEHVRSRDAGTTFPHTITKDKIGDMSIKLQFSQEEVWTKALRFMLLALKILLKWATSG